MGAYEPADPDSFVNEALQPLRSLVPPRDTAFQDLPGLAELGRELLFRTMTEKPQLQADSVLGPWYAAAAAGNPGLFFAVDTLTASGRFAEADSLNDVISPSNLHETNRRFVNDVRFGLLAAPMDTLQPRARDLLRDLAFGCPYTDGSAVYEARLLRAWFAKGAETYPEDLSLIHI